MVALEVTAAAARPGREGRQCSDGVFGSDWIGMLSLWKLTDEA